jgi:predicted transcriptional regulator
MRTTHTWTISLPPELSRLAEQIAKAEHRTRSELIREALRLYMMQRDQPLALGAGDRLARVGELAEMYRSPEATRRPDEAVLREQFRGMRRHHDRLRHLAP